MGLASAFIFAGCEEKEDFGPAEVSINPSEPIEIAIAGGDENIVTIELKATIDWALRGYDEKVRAWLTISPESGKASKSTQTITIKALKNEGANRSATITFYGNIVNQASLTITQPGEKGEAGTAENPFTVTDAIQFIKEGGYSGNENASDEVYVKGKISSITDPFNSEYGNATYKITDGTNELIVFRGYYINGIKFTSDDQIHVDDEVIIVGRLTDYNGDKEFISGNHIYSLNGQTEVEVDQTVPGGPWIYSNSFNGSIGDFTIDDKKTDPALSHVWAYAAGYGMKASAYISIDEDNGINYETESWLISPEIDLSGKSEAYLTFEHVTNFFNTTTLQDEATVWIKENGAADWTKLSGVTYPSSQSWDFIDAGDIDISTYGNKKIQIAFVYKSTATKAGTWEIRNVVVKEEADEVLPPVEVTKGSVILSFPDDNSENNKVGGYTDTWTAISGEYNFSITAFNNNSWNNSWTYIKCGRSKDASVATISTSTAMPELTAIEVTVDKINASKVNSITLDIYSDAAMGTAVAEDIEPRSAIAAGSMVFEIPSTSQAANQYYKLTFDCAIAGSNGPVQISKVTYIAAE